MATQETKQIDEIITSRRAMLAGVAALAAVAVCASPAHAANTVSTYADTDILNFALNLEYLESNFYYMAAFGCTIDAPNAAAIAAGAPSAGIGIGGVVNTGSTNPPAGITATTTGATRVPFATIQNASYAVETAIEEGKHVILLRTALGAAAVAQPPINISVAAFTAAANAAGIAGTFNPYSAGPYFLVGAYIFEDVGVTAYHGAASLIKSASILGTAASILAVEAYHGGLVRTSLNFADPTNAMGYLTITDQIAALRAGASLAANPMASNPDDFGLLTPSGAQPTVGVTLGAAGASASSTRTQTADVDANYIAFARNTNQVLNIVTLGGALTAGKTATGGFFPSGLNGLFS
jgi:hypothetical protein